VRPSNPKQTKNLGPHSRDHATSPREVYDAYDLNPTVECDGLKFHIAWDLISNRDRDYDLKWVLVIKLVVGHVYSIINKDA
jgi:hypothetical protein